jgi:hypothetical protein
MMILIRNVRRAPDTVCSKLLTHAISIKPSTVKFKTGHCQYHDLRTEVIERLHDARTGRGMPILVSSAFSEVPGEFQWRPRFSP